MKPNTGRMPPFTPAVEAVQKEEALSGRPPGIDPRQTGPMGKKWLKRMMARLERRETKKPEPEPETELTPKRRYSGYD